MANERRGRGAVRSRRAEGRCERKGALERTEGVWRKRTLLSLCLGSPHEIRVAERQSTSVCGVLGELREVHVYERCMLSRRTCSRGARPELGAVVLWSTRSREVATPFFFLYLGYV